MAILNPLILFKVRSLFFSLSFQQEPVKQSFCRSLRRDTHWKCLLLTTLIYSCLAAIAWCRLTVVTRMVVDFYGKPRTHTSRASPCEDGYVYIPVAFVVMLYLVYLVECWHCHTRIQLHGKVDVNTVYEKIAAMRESIPIVWWKAICYHYVRRTRQVTRYRNGDAFTTTQVYYERVNSHTSSSCFNFTACGIQDVSKNLINLDNYPATKIRFSKGFSFVALEAEQDFEDQRGGFFHENERRDDYMETREGLDLMNVNFKECLIAFADPSNLPWYVSHAVFWIASLLLLSWPLRVLIEYKTAYVHYHVHKLFGCNYLDSSYCLEDFQGHMTRVSTMGSSELEMITLRNNYTLVPSYSEAMLMDHCAPEPATTPNGSIPMVPLGAVRPSQSVPHMPNGTAGLADKQGPSCARSYRNLSRDSSRPTSTESSAGDVRVTRRQQIRRKYKRRRQSYTEAVNPPSDNESQGTLYRLPPPPSSADSVAATCNSQPSSSIANRTSTQDSLSELDNITMPSRESSFEPFIESPLSTEQRFGGSLSSHEAGSSEQLLPKVAKIGERPPCYEDALAMRMPLLKPGQKVQHSTSAAQNSSPSTNIQQTMTGLAQTVSNVATRSLPPIRMYSNNTLPSHQSAPMMNRGADKTFRLMETSLWIKIQNPAYI